MTTSDPADVARIRQFARDLPGGMAELVRHFDAQMSATMSELEQAAGEPDAEKVRVLAHRGVGTAGVCGADRMVAVLRTIESAARGGRVDAAALMEAVGEFARLRAFLDRLVAEDGERR
jgi:HPt (histidine-containing phosphotransfer) domain-containing protein